MLQETQALVIDEAVYEGFPQEFAERFFMPWYESDEQISFVDYLYRMDARRTETTEGELNG